MCTHAFCSNHTSRRAFIVSEITKLPLGEEDEEEGDEEESPLALSWLQ